MGKEPDNLVLKQLQGIRKDIAGVRETVDRVDERTATLERRLDDLHGIVTYTLGMASLAQHKTEELSAEMGKVTSRLKALEKAK